MDKEMVEPVISWFSLALIIAGIAQGKNRSGFGWWLFAMFVGPIALFLLVVFAEKIEPNTKNVVDSENATKKNLNQED